MPGVVGECRFKTGHAERPYLGKYLKDVSHVHIGREEHSRQSKQQVQRPRGRSVSEMFQKQGARAS